MAHPDVLDTLRQRREALGKTEASIYVHQKEINTIWQMEQEIKLGREAERRAGNYFAYLETLEEGKNWSWAEFMDHHNLQEINRMLDI